MTESTDLVIVPTGEVMPLATPQDCAAALDRLDELFETLKLAKRAVTDAAAGLSEELLTRTFDLGDGRKLKLSGGEQIEYDADEIRAELLEAGIHEQIVDEIVLMQPVSYRVDARRAKRAADTNAEVAEILKRHSRTIPKPYYVGIELPRPLA